MKEKRFLCDGSEYYIDILDTKKQLEHDIENPSQQLTLQECTDLLNSLSEENERLLKELFELKKEYLIDTSDITDLLYLDEEIEELKKEYGFLGE